MFFLVVSMGEEKLYANVPDTKDLMQLLYEFLLNQTSENDKILSSETDYEISQSKNPVSGAETCG